MKVIDLIPVINNDKCVLIIRVCSGIPVAEYDSIYNVELRFADEEVSMIDFDTSNGNYEIYIY